MDENINLNEKTIKIGQANNFFDEEKYNSDISEILLDEEKKTILLKLKKIGIKVNADNIPALLNVFTKDMVDFLDLSCDREKYIDIINLFLKNYKKQNIRSYVKRKKEYLEKNRTLSDEAFVKLFYDPYNKKAEINQQQLPLCYFYTAIETLKKTNAFDTLIKTNFRIVGDNLWEVRLPFGDKRGVWIKVYGDEVANTNITSNTSIGFKILEIACLKKKWLEKKGTYKNSDIKIDEEKMQWLKMGGWSADIHKLFISSANFISGTDGGVPDLFKELAFDYYKSGTMIISLIKKDGEERNDIGVVGDKTQNILSYGTEFRNYNGYIYPCHCGYTKYQDIKYIQYQDGYYYPSVKFCGNHVYSIEKCYIKNGEKRVQIVNPWYTGVKYDMSLETCKSIFDWEISYIDIDKMFSL